MSEDKGKDRRVVDIRSGFFGDLALRIKLILRLIADPRVNPLLKLLPVGSLIYFIIPDIAPGPIDDVAVIWLGAYLFVELCPPDVVQEHMDSLRQVVPGEWHEAEEMGGEVIEAQFLEQEDGAENLPQKLDTSQ